MVLAPLSLVGVSAFKGVQLRTLERKMMMPTPNKTIPGAGAAGAWFLPHTTHNGRAGDTEVPFLKDSAAAAAASHSDVIDVNIEESLWEQYLDPNGSMGDAFNMNMHHQQQDSNLAAFESVLTHLDLYLVPLIILVGLVGNSLSFVVFVCTHLKRSSCHIYLASLALADNLFLVCVSISWSDKIGVKLHTQAGWCQTQVRNAGGGGPCFCDSSLPALFPL